MNDHSVVIVVPTADKANVSKVLAALWGDDPPGTDEFSVQLSSDGNLPTSHWLLHLYRSNAEALVLAAMPTPVNVGTLPSGINLVPYGVSPATAQASCANITRVSVKTGTVLPANHVQDILNDLGLVEVVP